MACIPDLQRLAPPFPICAFQRGLDSMHTLFQDFVWAGNHLDRDTRPRARIAWGDDGFLESCRGPMCVGPALISAEDTEIGVSCRHKEDVLLSLVHGVR